MTFILFMVVFRDAISRITSYWGIIGSHKLVMSTMIMLKIFKAMFEILLEIDFWLVGSSILGNDFIRINFCKGA